jgi:biopolymer transport protein ExbD
MASGIAPGSAPQEIVEDRPEPIKVRKQLEDTEMDITPMIDITFLLLIFFLVASKMDESTAVTLPITDTGINIPVKESVIITVAEGKSDETAAVYKGDGISAGNEIPYPDVDSLVTGIVDYVKAETENDPNKKWVLIQGAGGVKYKHVNEVAKAAANNEQITNMGVGVSQEN